MGIVSVLGGIAIYVALLLLGLALVLHVEESLMGELSEPQRRLLNYADWMIKGSVGGFFTIAGAAVAYFVNTLRSGRS